ncbi:hypothetical protein TNCV_2138181 [Trichonephila clavipes]|nr:hypothetical protein TNCV_2138181 [Trichonephila clavipes]
MLGAHLWTHRRDERQSRSCPAWDLNPGPVRSGIGGEREDDIEELTMGHEDELTIELQENLNEEHQETQRNVSSSEQEEDEKGPMPTSAIKGFFKKVGCCQSNGLRRAPKPR